MKHSSLIYLLLAGLLIIPGCESGNYDEDGGDYMAYSPAYYTYGPQYYGAGYYGYGNYYDVDYIVTPPGGAYRPSDRPIRPGDGTGRPPRVSQPIARPGLGNRAPGASQRPMRSMPSIPSRSRAGGGGGMRRR